MTGLPTPPGYRALDTESLRTYIASIELSRQLGGSPEDWSIEEVGDGNLNLVFLIRSYRAGFAVKQALPYVRLVGESWPLPLSRAHFEHLALSSQAKITPDLVPAIHHYDEALALIVMEFLGSHIIMRKGMLDGIVYPRFAEDISTFMAANLFGTSALHSSAKDFKDRIAAFASNTALCKISEDLIFTEPYIAAENNRWTSPWLDGHAASIRSDMDLKIAVSRLKLKFISSAEALIHGDLHTGSVMVNADDTRVIDPEFAFMGPMGFDPGAVIANLLLNYFSGSPAMKAGPESATPTETGYWTRSSRFGHCSAKSSSDFGKHKDQGTLIRAPSLRLLRRLRWPPLSGARLWTDCSGMWLDSRQQR